MKDKISPDHYKLANGFQVIDLTSQLGFCAGNVVKYVARAGNKAGESTLDDLLKAEYYLRRLIDDAKAKRQTGGTTRGLCPPGDLDGFTATG